MNVDYKWSKGERLFWSCIGAIIIVAAIIGLIAWAKSVL